MGVWVVLVVLVALAARQRRLAVRRYGSSYCTVMKICIFP
jgi:hypothetical protein